MTRILTVVGARPQFIKAAAVSRAFREDGRLDEILLHTGQHYDENMSEIFFSQLSIPRPTINLGVGSGPHGRQTAQMLEGIEEVIMRERPDAVLVYGDTNSTLAAAIAAVKLHVPLAHVEAGLRSFNRRMPEEINRVLTDHASSLLFAPTAGAVANLRAEGINAGIIHESGDVMFDAALHFSGVADRESTVLQGLGLTGRRYVLATIHRAENTDDPVRLAAIIEGLALVARDVAVVLPLHPRTKTVLAQHQTLAKAVAALQIVPPVGYIDMIQLERHAALVVTDSGGVQKEAFFFGVPCATLRDESEWVELIESGWNTLVPPRDPMTVRDRVMARLGTRGRAVAPYGDGRSARRIVEMLSKCTSS